MANAVIAVGWSYMFYFFLIFVFLSIFSAVFVKAYEQSIRYHNTGYPEDFAPLAKWAYGDYLYWAIEQWMPQTILRKIKKKSSNENENEDGSADQKLNRTLEEIMSEEDENQ